ncbi:MAG: hypothetical protein LKH76_02545 [Acetobacter fabarum]|jgi:hypothetical protein|uniref:Uncharacterized protein n=1 Tax=Acetobacter fabarum TaxID=483199 RepID=A0A269Y4H3_9PROT|nr:MULTISPECIES: hypothetical protein [Acetobacter]MCH4027111.1 hypothetical protein [Acetobacter fabarum]MCH4055400.1 hypothetical protein [Acetobacter fabarum]MCH4085027.1 hypothetical protein [Acetobacter fabarum]MCH4127767.1 hypothetical protein [Acetobacter fabarum]MCH4137730.1 hypothetical protein [Acetobacter fabarum]
MCDAEKPVTPTTTEETPSVPGWVEPALDTILATLPFAADKLAPLRASYLDCLAGCGRAGDLDMEHDACRKGFLRALVDTLGLAPDATRTLEQQLEKLELDISAQV